MICLTTRGYQSQRRQAPQQQRMPHWSTAAQHSISPGHKSSLTHYRPPWEHNARWSSKATHVERVETAVLQMLCAFVRDA